MNQLLQWFQQQWKTASRLQQLSVLLLVLHRRRALLSQFKQQQQQEV
jgi:hypothetical protein